jgi:hypothetical protein
MTQSAHTHSVSQTAITCRIMTYTGTARYRQHHSRIPTCFNTGKKTGLTQKPKHIATHRENNVFHYKHQQVKDVSWNFGCLMYESYGIDKHTVWTECRVHNIKRNGTNINHLCLKRVLTCCIDFQGKSYPKDGKSTFLSDYTASHAVKQ